LRATRYHASAASAAFKSYSNHDLPGTKPADRVLIAGTSRAAVNLTFQESLHSFEHGAMNGTEESVGCEQTLALKANTTRPQSSNKMK
jgi:hypothetical protein